MNLKKIALFAAGTLFGSAGFKLLSSKDDAKAINEARAAEAEAAVIEDAAAETTENTEA